MKGSENNISDSCDKEEKMLEQYEITTINKIDKQKKDYVRSNEETYCL